MTSYEICMRWLNEILKGRWKQYLNIFKMDATTFQSLCFDLESKHG